MVNRRKFIQLGALGASSIFAKETLATNTFLSEERQLKTNKIKFAIITDLHYDLMHDSDRRAKVFVDAMKQQQPDFIIQLGDFCMPKTENQKLMDVWNTMPGEKYHVLGNHDTDHGHTKEQALAFWGAPAPYYSFDRGDFHFVILDGNEKSLTKELSGYPRTIEKKQLNWLKEDLRKTKLRTVIFCHQGFDNTINGLDNGMEVRYLLEQINKEAGFKKVILVFSGHHHMNYHNEINGIHYVQINSASYYWAGGDYQSKAFEQEFYKKHSILKHTLVYQDPIWAVVTLDGKNNIQIEGKETQMVGVPLEKTEIDIHKDVYPITSKIDSRKIRYK
ncbi:metallophosphoesterase [Sphingobacterium sp. UT-1RO-CII-1]|uniref:metallophosphoesterase family protein n=1 Tax=Sphingobacterium sp. UT-1RO-CII-1 TaxID=2995225 RepID=UPI00227ACF87|nr:metallophosphoesterase [Sphingobacterium sp. UT-1RO-CII-1]MCY4778102.1 metallophosphoesterase [Sphingobacterium sp. UT-1RO-CII-1]